MITLKTSLIAVRSRTELLAASIKFWLFLGVIIAVESGFTGLLPSSRGFVFHNLEIKSNFIWMALFAYFINYFLLDLIQSVKGYVITKAALCKRTIETSSVVGSLNTTTTTLPQRIQEDIKLAHLSGITVTVEYIISFLIFLQLVYLNFDAPILLVSATVYSILSVLIAIQFNPRLRKAEIDVQEQEARYRSGLVTNPTDLALLPVANLYTLKAKWIETEYLLFTRLQLGLLNVLPYIVLIPGYFEGSIDLGQLMAHQAAFSLLVVNASILIQMYPTYIKGRACRERVSEISKV